MQVYYWDSTFAMGHVVIRSKKTVVGDESKHVFLFRCIQSMNPVYPFNTCYTGGEHIQLCSPFHEKVNACRPLHSGQWACMCVRLRMCVRGWVTVIDVCGKEKGKCQFKV